MVLQRTERRRRPPILVEPAPADDHLAPGVLRVLVAANDWDAHAEQFGADLRAPRLRWAGLFRLAASTGVTPARAPSVAVGHDGLPVDLL